MGLPKGAADGAFALTELMTLPKALVAGLGHVYR